jgi:hypothetical protein
MLFYLCTKAASAENQGLTYIKTVSPTVFVQQIPKNPICLPKEWYSSV